MDLEQLKKNYPKLLNYMKEKGYSGEAYYCTKTTIELILTTNDPNWKSYDDVRISLKKLFPKRNAQSRCMAALNRIVCFDLYNEYPNWKPHPELEKRGSYYSLDPEYRSLVDEYHKALNRLPLKDITVYGRVKAVSSILLKLQQKGIRHLSSIKEDDIIQLYWNNGNPYGKRYRRDFKEFLSLVSIPKDISKRVASYMPKNKSCQKNKQYLSKEEAESIRTVLQSETLLSLRDRAIGSLLFYTGLRAVDISNLRLSDIQWDKDEISIIQDKTSVSLQLPLDPVYGNLIYDYIHLERPATKESCVFVSSRRPYEKLSRSAVSSRIVNTIFDAAKIRMKKGEQRGSHIFRHHVVSSMLENEETHIAISSILGHSSASSVQPYLNTDFSHLKECALSIDDYPVSEEAYLL